MGSIPITAHKQGTTREVLRIERFFVVLASTLLRTEFAEAFILDGFDLCSRIEL